MENTYVIFWKSKSEPRSGRGKKMLSREDAEALAHQLNCDHPLFFHQAVDLAVFRHAPAPSVIIPVDFQPLTVDADFTFAAAATEAPQAARA